MTGSPMGSVFGRRRFVLTAAGTVTGATVAGLVRPSPSIAASVPSSSRVSPVPNPIPGGLELAPGFVIHVFPPGDPTVTLPFSGLTLAGFDAMPVTLTDFNGSAAVAYHVGTARGSDGTAYNLETDIRAFEGEYMVEGKAYQGSFALIWIDIYDPGSGSQLHDFNGGILQSGLFWTLDVGKTAVDFKVSDRRAVLHVKNVPLIDTFQFFGPSSTPGIVDFRAEWEASGAPVSRGMGGAVAPTDPRAFLGDIAPAVSTGVFSGSEIGFEFESNRASTSPGGYAQIGTVRNGVFL